MRNRTEVAERESELLVEEVGAEEETEEHAQYDLLTYPADFTLEVLYQKLAKNRDIFVPSFQRMYVWSHTQASRLIESFLLGLPVPPVFLYEKRGAEKLLVVDGQQRLRTVCYFFDGHFGEEKGAETLSVFRLKLDDHSKWNGLTFAELAEEDKTRLKNSVLRAYIMKQLDPKDDTSVFHVFERLNTGGTQLTAQEVRNCIYEGAFNSLLHELNRLPSWREILGRTAPDPRLKDLELILRFLALWRNLERYEKPMSEFLNDFMIAHRDGASNEEYRSVFQQTSDEVKRHLGPSRLRKKGRLVTNLSTVGCC